MTDLVKFLRLILADEGFKIGCLKLSQGMHQQISTSHEELAEKLFLGMGQGLDVYHACATYQNEHGIWNEKKQKMEIRCVANIAWLSAFWFDLDLVKKGGQINYPSLIDAWKAFEAWRQMRGLPPPVYVSSGGGLHCYWPLAVPIPYSQWHDIASVLKQCAQADGLLFDPARTADGASILRPPLTKNFKYQPPRPVEIGDLCGPYQIGPFQQLAENYDGPVARNRNNTGSTQTAGRDRPNAAPGAIGPGQHGGRGQILASAASAIYGDRPYYVDLIQQSCGQIRRFAGQGLSLDEPTWYAGAGIFGFVKDRELALAWGAGYGGYDRASTDQWINSKCEQWRVATTGPTTCGQFESLEPAICQACPFFGKINTPLVLGTRARNNDPGKHIPNESETNNAASPQAVPRGAPAPSETFQGTRSETGFPRQINGSTVHLPMLPMPWRFGTHGEVEFVSEDRDGNSFPTVVSDFPIYLDTIHQGEIGGLYSYRFRQFLPHHPTPWTDIVIDGYKVYSAEGLNTFASQGATIREPKMFHNYTRDLVYKYHMEQAPMTQYEQFGWKPNGFLYGMKLYTPTKVIDAVTVTELATRVKFKGLGPGDGSIDEWRGAVSQLFASGNEAQSIVFLTGFGAVLQHFYEQEDGGCIWHIWSRSSSFGKTAALTAVASIWGTKLDCIRLVNIDTQVSQAMTLGFLGHLPCVFDEFGKRDPEWVRNFVETFTNGRDKMRADQSGDHIKHRAAAWQTYLISGGNVSLVEIIRSLEGSDAMALRIFELDAIKGDISSAEVTRLKATMLRNGGIAGDMFIRYLMRDDVRPYIKPTLDAYYQQMWDITKLPNEFRFLVQGATCVTLAAEFIWRMGLITFNPQRIIDALIARLKNEKTMLPKDVPALQLVSDFLVEHSGCILTVVDKFAPHRRCRVKTPHKLQLLIRFEEETDRFYIHCGAFHKWLIKHGYAPRLIVQDLRDANALLGDYKLMTLGAGTDFTSGQTRCMILKGDAVTGISRELRTPALGSSVSSQLTQRVIGA